MRCKWCGSLVRGKDLFCSPECEETYGKWKKQQSVCKECKWSAKLYFNGVGHTICDYLYKTGKMRGCDWYNCKKLEKR